MDLWALTPSSVDVASARVSVAPAAASAALAVLVAAAATPVAVVEYAPGGGAGLPRCH